MATKLATKEASITKSESMVLMKNMMRISISSVCFVRDLFPRSCFKNKPYGNVDIHQLQGAKKDEGGDIVVTHPDAFLLTQWLEQGVFHALELEYLSSVTFAIYSKHPVTKDDILLETYEFKAAYQGEEAAKINDVALASKDSVKNQAAKFIRSLTEFAGTLDVLPDSCWITLQIKYYDHTPADYEPEYFRASDGSVAAVAKNLPLKINIGNLRTPTVEMNLRYAGLDSLLFEDLCKVSPQAAPSIASSKATPSIFKATNCAIAEELQRMAVSPFTTQNSPAASPAAHEEAEPSLLSVEAEKEVDKEPVQMAAPTPEERVKAYVLEGSAVSVPGCAKALGLTVPVVRKAFNQLVQDGVIKPKGRGYQIQAPKTVTPDVRSGAPSSVPAQAAAANPLPQEYMTPQEDHSLATGAASVSTTSRCSVPPNAPRKVVVKPPQYACDGSQMTDDIEDTFQDATTSPAVSKLVSAGYHQPALQLVHGKANVSSAAKRNDQQPAAVRSGKENAPSDNDAANRKRGAQEAMDAVAMSQESVMSEASASAASRKKPRKCSVIRDPIALTGLDAVARNNQTAGAE